MRASYDKKLLNDLNNIEQGLNFLVPREWWRNFQNKNEHIQCYKEIRMEESYPLDYLLQTGILEHSMPDCRNKIRNLLGGSDETFKSIKRQIKKCQTPEVGRGPKRGKEICEWMWEDEGVSRQEVDMILSCPKINGEMADLFQMRSDNWEIVSPELYRLIWQIERREKRQESDKIMVAIPIVIKKNHQVYYQETINYNNLSYFETYIHNSHGKKFIFMGYIDGDIRYKRLLKVINEGMFKLCSSGRQKFVFKQKNVVMRANNQNGVIIYDFYDEDYKSQLDWAQFSTIASTKLQDSALYRFVVFSGSTKRCESDQENREIGPFKKIKRVNSDISAGSDGGVKFARRAEVQPIVLQGESKTRQVEVIDVHSSTQEQTPSDLGQRDAFVPAASYHHISKIQRIAFPIWRDRCPETLMRYGQIRSSIPKIVKPYSDQGAIVIREEGKKIVLPRESNSLTLNELGQWEEKESRERIVEDSEIPNEEVSHQLEMLAMQILGMKISEASQVKKAEVDLVKQNSEYEQIMTCKNDEGELQQQSNVE